ncbi:branched chain amino acid aminotransferase [Chitiniphilus shinanonensis]|uniref:Branched chain amino acid aminotransferase n=1 Tax=Chitiniphilus shinanonensis TaxID=553088 RepID=A0ABQ6BUP4_9NEIS|nr:aminotransferase class IV [Chitiniphilus shinanonensis]GLS05072.1 branched chain amino acid aminotransferase [Chitiniphilus shinanonensis]
MSATTTAPRHYGWVHLDGELRPAGDASLPLTTQAFNYGTGVFEGIRAYRTHAGALAVFRLDDHLRRLQASARLLKIDSLPDLPALRDAVLAVLRRNECNEDCYIRPLAFKKALLPGAGFGVKLHGVSDGFAINCLPMPSPPVIGALRCCVPAWRRVPDYCIPARAKVTGLYANSALAMEAAHSAGCDDAILLNVLGNVAEATTTNVFIRKGRRLLTPPSTAHILEGITRDTVRRLAAEHTDLVIEERDIALTDLYGADECFLTGTGREIAAVVAIDGYQIGDGQPGPTASALFEQYRAAVRGGLDRHSDWITPVY